MENNELILEELINIRKLLTILAQDKLEAFNKYIEKKYLTTDPRKKMYELFDGTMSYAEIASSVGTSGEGVRQFAVLLESANIVEHVKGEGKGKYPKRIF